MPRPASARPAPPPAPACGAAACETTAYGHHATVFDVALAPPESRRSRWIASAGEDEAVRLWAPADGGRYSQAAFSRAHGEPVLRVSWSPTAELLASAGGDACARVWRVSDDGDGATSTITQALTLGPADDEGYACEFTADGGRLVTTAGAGVAVWSLETGVALAADPPPAAPPAPAMLANPRWAEAHVFGARLGSGGLLAAACSDGVARLWAATPAGLAGVAAHRTHACPLTAVAWAPDGVRLAAAGADGSVALVDARAGGGVPWRGASAGRPMALAFLSDAVLAVATSDSTLELFGVGGGGGGSNDAGPPSPPATRRLVETVAPGPRDLLCVAVAGDAVAVSGARGGVGGRAAAAARARAVDPLADPHPPSTHRPRRRNGRQPWRPAAGQVGARHGVGGGGFLTARQTGRRKYGDAVLHISARCAPHLAHRAPSTASPAP